MGKAAKQAQQAPFKAAKQVQQAAPVQAGSSTQPKPKAKQAPWQSFFGGKKTESKGTDAAGPSSSSTPSLQEAAETAQSGLADGADISISTGYFEVSFCFALSLLLVLASTRAACLPCLPASPWILQPAACAEMRKTWLIK